MKKKIYETDIHTGCYLEVEETDTGSTSWIRNHSLGSNIFVCGITADEAADEVKFEGFLEYSLEIFHIMTRGRVMSRRRARRKK